MKKKQIKYIAVKPDGSICGPCGDTREFVQKSLIIGFSRVTGETIIWEEIERLGYSVRKCKIKLID